MRFVKMQGCGNDYVYVDLFEERIADAAALSVRLSDRHCGIGSDGLITIEPSDRADFRMRIYNADGSEAQMCGNGIRCAAKYFYDHGRTDNTQLAVETKAGIRRLKLFVRDKRVHSVRVDMGEPQLEPARIPVASEGDRVIDMPVSVCGKEWRMTCISMGNPHAVLFVEELSGRLIREYGPLFERHPLFPERTNAEFVKVHSGREISLRVWERGSGETLGCGTGACAAVMACILSNKTGENVLVHLRGGELTVGYDRKTKHMWMTGPAVEVFCGEIELKQTGGVRA